MDSYQLTSKTSKVFGIGKWDGKNVIIGTTRSGKKVFDAHDPVYDNILKEVMYHDASKLRKLTQKAFPKFTKEDHVDASKYHAKIAKKSIKAWNNVIEPAWLSRFGRKYEPLDYKVSGVADDRLPESVKKSLRLLSFLETNSRFAAEAHVAASKYIRSKEIQESNKMKSDLQKSMRLGGHYKAYLQDTPQGKQYVVYDLNPLIMRREAPEFVDVVNIGSIDTTKEARVKVLAFVKKLENEESKKHSIKGMVTSYRSISDAGKELNDPDLSPGKTHVFYLKSDFIFRNGKIVKYTETETREMGLPKTRAEMNIYYDFLGNINSTNLETIYRKLQGEYWSGEKTGEKAQEFIESKNISHTSMSIGDAIIIGNELAIVHGRGFKKITLQPS